MSTDSSNDEPQPRQLGKVPWNPWLGFFFGILIFIVAQIVAGILISLYPAVRGWSHEQAVSWLQNALVAQLTYLSLSVLLTIGGVLAFVRSYGRPGLRSIGIKKPKWVDPLYGLAAFPIYYLVLVIAVLITQALVPSFNAGQAQDLGLNGRYGTVQLIFIFICLAGLAPLAEEILFRGFIYSSLKKAMSLWGAVLITSSLFAAGHLAEGGSSGPLYIGAIDTFILSLVLIYLREKTGRLWAGVTLHSLKNIIAFVSIFVIHVR
jgi:membrane protease YdiL (CAAX protease family)